jgi:hypothetical protein
MNSDSGLDQQVWDGIQSLLDDYAKINASDKVVIAYTPDSREPAAWVALACEQRALIPRTVPMAPLRDSGFRSRLSEAIPETPLDDNRIVFFVFERETMSHNKIIKSIFSRYPMDKYQVIRAINSGRDLFVTGLSMKPDQLSALNTTLLERCRRAKSLLIKAAGGTRLNVELDNDKFQYKSSRGVGAPGKFIVIPPGEVATFPKNISGVLVADFAINVNVMLNMDVRLEASPVIVEVENGRLVRFDCSNVQMKDFLTKCFQRNNATYVGELGFGTNKAVTNAVFENSHLNERVPGVHLGFGQHNQTDEAAGYSCDIHIDLCAKGGLVWFDDMKEPLDLEQLSPSQIQHPQLISGEDVFSEDAEDDCCGILR